MNLVFSLLAWGFIALAVWTLIRGGRGAAMAAFLFFCVAVVLVVCALGAA